MKKHVVVQRFALDYVLGFGIDPGLVASRQADEVCDRLGRPFGVQFDFDVAFARLERCLERLIRNGVCGRWLDAGWFVFGWSVLGVILAVGPITYMTIILPASGNTARTSM